METARKTQSVNATQKAVDAVRFDSGTWRVEGVKGLYLRSHKASKSYFLQKRIRGKLVKVSLKAAKVKQAEAEAMALFGTLKPKPAVGEVWTLQKAFDDFMGAKFPKDSSSSETIRTHTGNFERHLKNHWGKISLVDLGNNRAGVRAHYYDIKNKIGNPTARGVMKLLAAVYRWRREVDLSLPECPTTAVKMEKAGTRNWALKPADLRIWWDEIQAGRSVIASMFFTICLFTGARRGSVECLEWRDVDFDAGTIFFRKAKKNRTYTVPISDRLQKLLIEYRHSSAIKPGERWVIPGAKPGTHMTKVEGRSHHLRHQFKTDGTNAGVLEVMLDVLQGHTLYGVSRGYQDQEMLDLRKATNRVSEHYAKILELDVDFTAAEAAAEHAEETQPAAAAV